MAPTDAPGFHGNRDRVARGINPRFGDLLVWIAYSELADEHGAAEAHRIARKSGLQHDRKTVENAKKRVKEHVMKLLSVAPQKAEK